MSKFEDLLAAKKAAEQELAAEEQELESALIAAKAAYREDPSEENRMAKAAAVADIQACRAAVRKDRTGLIGGDAFVSPVQNEG